VIERDNLGSFSTCSASNRFEKANGNTRRSTASDGQSDNGIVRHIPSKALGSLGNDFADLIL
jgi:hypothetical protein